MSTVYVATKVFNQHSLGCKAVEDAKATNALVVDPALIADCDSFLYIQKNTIVLGFTLIYKNNFVGHSWYNIGGDRGNLE